MTDLGQVALAARVFSIATLTALAGVAGVTALRGALLLDLTVLVAVVVSLVPRVPGWLVATIEGCVVAALAAASYPSQGALTSYLVIPALLVGLDLGLRMLGVLLAAEFAVLGVTWTLAGHPLARADLVGGLTLMAAAVGLGLIGTLLRRALSLQGHDGGYRSAVTLIRRLDALSDRLSSGLDAVGIAERVMDEADLEQHTLAAAVFVRSRGGEVSPLRYAAGSRPGSMTWAQELAERSWERRATLLDGPRAALPLVSADEVVAVVTFETATPLEARRAAVLERRLAAHALQLQAALLFARVREAATAQERRRIAREVHDGVAQDVASLGYLVDNLAGVITAPEQRQQVVQLREQVTRVVGDLRRSVFDLRQETAASSGLGESVSAYAHRIAATSPMAVHVTLDEEGPRLPPDVEFELMRIAQEAMANARKHSQAANLWLRCTVRAPYAEIEVRDDGVRPHSPGEDSHGLTIMRERAATVGGDLVIEGPGPKRPGTRVSVRVGVAPSYTADGGHGVGTEVHA